MKTSNKILASSALLMALVACGKKDDTTVVSAAPNPTPKLQQPMPTQMPGPVVTQQPSVLLPPPAPVLQAEVKAINVGNFAVTLNQDFEVVSYSKGYNDFGQNLIAQVTDSQSTCAAGTSSRYFSFSNSMPQWYCFVTTYNPLVVMWNNGNRLAANSVMIRTSAKALASNTVPYRIISVSQYTTKQGGQTIGSLVSAFDQACNTTNNVSSDRTRRVLPNPVPFANYSSQTPKFPAVKLVSCTSLADDGLNKLRVTAAIFVDKTQLNLNPSNNGAYNNAMTEGNKPQTVFEIIFKESLNSQNEGDGIADSFKDVMPLILRQVSN